MAVKIRLARGGQKKAPFYRIVAADSRMPRDGRFLEKLGTYDPMSKALELNKESIEKWFSRGAIPTETVVKIFTKEEVAVPEKFKLNHAK